MACYYVKQTNDEFNETVLQNRNVRFSFPPRWKLSVFARTRLITLAFKFPNKIVKILVSLWLFF